MEDGDMQSKPRLGCLQGKTPCQETRSFMGFGAALHVFPKLGEFSHKMELWPHAFQRRVFDTQNAGCSCQGGLPLSSHTSSPGGKERNPQAPRQTLRGQWAVRRGLNLHHPAGGSAGKDFPEPTCRRSSALRSLTRSGLFCSRGNRRLKRLSKPPTPQPSEGLQWP